MKRNNRLWPFFLLLLLLLLVVIIIVIIKSNNSNNESAGSTVATITKDNGEVFHVSSSLDSIIFEKDFRGKYKYIVYIEGKFCATCWANALDDLTSFFCDSMPEIKPLMIYHNDVLDDINAVNSFYDYFEKEYNIIVSNNDSVRTRNEWISPLVSQYGIIVDSEMNIQFAGFLFSNSFKKICLDYYRSERY